MPVTDKSVTEALHKRRSVRAFTDQPVDPALLKEVFAVAQRAPSGGNLQPWQVTLLTGEPWQAVKDEVAARIAMGRGGQQPDYDIYPRELTEPWTDRRFGRKCVFSGKSVSGRVDQGGRRIIKKKN